MVAFIRNWKVRLAITLAILTALTLPAVAGAHANLLRSDPADGAILEEGPAEVRLWFDEAISNQFSSVQLFDADSQPVPISDVRVDTTDPTLLILSLPDLADGPYSVLYKVLSDSDGHFSQGLLVFGVGAATDLGAANLSQAQESKTPLPEVVLRWFNFTLLAGAVGAIAIGRLVLRPAWLNLAANSTTRRVLFQARGRVLNLATICAWLAFVVGFGMLGWQSVSLLASLPQGASIWAVGRQILTATTWGSTWIGRQAILLLLASSLLVFRRRSVVLLSPRQTRHEEVAWFALALLTLTLIAVQALSSHASSLAENSSLALVADGLHLTAASLWVGGLLSLAAGLLPLLRRQKGDITILIKAGWRPFSLVAAFSVGLLVATGLYSAGRQVASFDALLTTFYGQALLGKVGLMLAAGLVGLLNSMLLHPQLATPLAWILKRPAGWTPLPLRQLPALVAVEGTLGLAVLLMTGLVTASAAPRSAEFTIVPEEVPTALSQHVDDMVITLGAKPNRPGQNVFSVFARSTRRPPPAEIARVILRFIYQEEDVGRESVAAEEIEPGRYLIAGDYLNLAGPWQIDVVVRRLGLQDSVAHFHWIVAPPGETRPVVVSRAPLEPLLTLAAALLLLAIPVVVAAVWLGRPWLPKIFSRNRRAGAEVARRALVIMKVKFVAPLIAVILVLLSLALSGCSLAGGSGSGSSDLDLKLDVDPNPPAVGPSHLVVALADPGGTLIDEATVSVEGSMPEGAMQPLSASLRPTQEGQYEAPFAWTMGGNWMMAVEADLPDGREISRQFTFVVAEEMDAGHAVEGESFHPPRIPNEGAVIRILAPADGTVFEAGRDIRVAVEFENFELAVDGTHWHIYDNGRSARMVMGDMTEAALPGLEPGEHEISAFMSIGSHEELEEAASVTITVRDAPG